MYLQHVLGEGDGCISRHARNLRVPCLQTPAHNTLPFPCPQCHPDKNPGDAAAHERFQKISVAYSVLSDDGKRRYYDQTGTTEGLDISPDEFMDMFQSLLLEIVGGADMIRVRRADSDCNTAESGLGFAMEILARRGDQRRGTCLALGAEPHRHAACGRAGFGNGLERINSP